MPRTILKETSLKCLLLLLMSCAGPPGLQVNKITYSASSQSQDTTAYGMKNIDSKIELFCTDPLRSIEFYTKLGFKLLAQKEDLYTTMKRNDFIIVLSPVKKSKSLRRP